MSFMVHCDFEKVSQNQHFQSTLLVGREGVTKRVLGVYAVDDVENYGRPLSQRVLRLFMYMWDISIFTYSSVVN